MTIDKMIEILEPYKNSMFGDQKYGEVSVKDIIEALKEQKTGEWIPCAKSGLYLSELMRREGQKWYGYKCSNCNYIHKGNALLQYNYCPKCGAKMEV